MFQTNTWNLCKIYDLVNSKNTLAWRTSVHIKLKWNRMFFFVLKALILSAFWKILENLNEVVKWILLFKNNRLGVFVVYRTLLEFVNHHQMDDESEAIGWIIYIYNLNGFLSLGLVKCDHVYFVGLFSFRVEQTLNNKPQSNRLKRQLSGLFRWNQLWPESLRYRNQFIGSFSLKCDAWEQISKPSSFLIAIQFNLLPYLPNFNNQLALHWIR